MRLTPGNQSYFMQEKHESRNTTSSNRLWLIISAIIAVTVVAVLMVPDNNPPTEDIPLPVALQKSMPQVDEEKKSVDTKPVVAAMPQASQNKQVERIEEGVAARTFLAQSKGTGLKTDDVFEQAQQFQSEGKRADAWLLYFKAAKEGHVQAALFLAQQADPIYFKAEDSLLSKPDVVQAHKWYVLAQQNGSELATKRLKMLLAGLERSARAGDERAALLLEKWK